MKLDVIKKNKLLTTSLLMLVVPEILFSHIIGFATMFITRDLDDYYSLITIKNVYLGIFIVFIQFLGTIGLIIVLFSLAKKEKQKRKKNVLYLLSLFLVLLLCFTGFIIFLLYAFRDLSIGL